MKRLIMIWLLAPVAALASGPFTSLHPEEHLPDAVEQPSSDPYTGFISKVQEKLHALGFDPGPVNGDLNAKTQAALAQFQLSRTIPAGAQLDDLTLQELGVERPSESAAAGGEATGGTEAGGSTEGGG
jgi:peptidoglycan hydrolase-like protein with peptidoglycan-binding domain